MKIAIPSDCNLQLDALFVMRAMFDLRRCLSVLLAVFLSTLGGEAVACSRDPHFVEPPLEELYTQASYVFAGHVVGIEEIDSAANAKEPLNSILKARIHVVESLKGNLEGDLDIKGEFFNYEFICNNNGILIPGINFLFLINSFDFTERGAIVKISPLDKSKSNDLEKLRGLAH